MMGLVLPLLFISYRRTDSQLAALGFYTQLRARIGPASVFMDRSGISAGDVWPERLREAIENATAVVALIGPDWLKSSDEYGRRRLDSRVDWVRNELARSIKLGKPIFPILIGAATKMPPPIGLPSSLAPLCSYQSYSLREDHWELDLNALVDLLVEKYSFREAEKRVLLPRPEIMLKELTQAELDKELMLLPGWEPVESLMPADYPRSRKELRRVYVFRAFRAAVSFMSAAVGQINELQHHPRWENQWRTVTVYLSTWDIGFKISALDVQLAKLLDALFESQEGKRGQA